MKHKHESEGTEEVGPHSRYSICSDCFGKVPHVANKK